MGTHEQHSNFRRSQGVFNLFTPICPGFDFAIIPHVDGLSLDIWFEKEKQFVQPLFIFVAITDENQAVFVSFP